MEGLPTPVDDDSILELARVGARSEAITAFAAAHGARLAALCRRLTGSVADGEDAWQETLIQVDRSLPFRLAKERAIERFERAYIGPLLEECEGNMSKAARTARMDRMYLHQLAQKYGFKIGRRNPPEG